MKFFKNKKKKETKQIAMGTLYDLNKSIVENNNNERNIKINDNNKIEELKPIEEQNEIDNININEEEQFNELKGVKAYEKY